MRPIGDEEKSAATTLSDMEIFVFPELMFSLVLANILSPRLWRWRELEWFAGIREMRPKKRLQRLRQHIMDNYTFNLDLDTWGLTKQAVELKRFAPFLSPEAISASNALFGYQGDAYYYDIDIRRHFGLDKYTSDTIPYWKTETIEAMDAFRHKDGHAVGAGECVSLAGLYAAAAFVVCGLPLESIFLMATPLHSQNFIDVDEGILTNNRRLVTRTMWANGTVISQQARRALDRLVGYKISPLLWTKVKKGLSAGRVQSVATRMVVDREREIEAFIPEEYWDVNVLCTGTGGKQKFHLDTRLISLDGTKAKITSAAEAEEAVRRIQGASLQIRFIKIFSSI